MTICRVWTRTSHQNTISMLFLWQTLSEMTELLSSSSNYSTYRRVYNECGGFKIPILGVQLKDLVSLNEALPDYLDDGKINVSKLQSLYQHILELRQLKIINPPSQANKDLILLLTVSRVLSTRVHQWSSLDLYSKMFFSTYRHLQIPFTQRMRSILCPTHVNHAIPKCW